MPPVIAQGPRTSGRLSTARRDLLKARCAWARGADPSMRDYHDTEWGVPVHDDRRHFEFLILEGAQAGLSWSVVLHKRAGYARAFERFDPSKVARWREARVESLVAEPSIIRNRAKIRSAVENARRFLELQREFGSFDAYVWPFVGGRPIQNRRRRPSDVPATTPESDELSEDLRRRGFRFVGSTVIYAHMQATGMVNDHLLDCFRYREVIRPRPTGPTGQAQGAVRSPRRRGRGRSWATRTGSSSATAARLS